MCRRQLHGSTATHLVVGDLGADGKDDLVFDFPDYGLHEWKNDSTWVPLHAMHAEALAIGNLSRQGAQRTWS